MTNVIVRGQAVELTQETIDATLRWYADHNRALARAAQAGEFRVNDLAAWIAGSEASAAQWEAMIGGDPGRMWLGFWQRAIDIQTGECVPILPL